MSRSLQRARLRRRAVLIIAASADPDWSFAALRDAAEQGKSFLRRRGGDVGRQDREVHRVGSRVDDERQSALSVADVQAAAARRAAAPLRRRPRRRRGRSPVSTTSRRASRSIGDEFNVDRGVVDKILENQAELMRQARIVPEQENGKVVGIRLFGVRPDTLLGTLGWRTATASRRSTAST
jgi:general secretion pathway protein C